MLNQTEFDGLKKELKEYDEKREVLIKTCRDVIKLSKTIIYAIHRNELKDALKSIKDSEKVLKILNGMIETENALAYEGSYRAAVQEYVEAVLYYHWVKDNRIASKEELEVETTHYLLGLTDLTGELARRALVAATQGRTHEVQPIRDVVEEIHDTLLTFDFRSGELRKKFDQIKYDLRRLDDAAFQLSLKG